MLQKIILRGYLKDTFSVGQSGDSRRGSVHGRNPFDIFENQIVPVGLHNLSKSFKPNLATLRILSVGTKFIPTWKKDNTKDSLELSKKSEKS